jgi:hypothetical protein
VGRATSTAEAKTARRRRASGAHVDGPVPAVVPKGRAVRKGPGEAKTTGAKSATAGARARPARPGAASAGGGGAVVESSGASPGAGQRATSRRAEGHADQDKAPGPERATKAARRAHKVPAVAGSGAKGSSGAEGGEGAGHQLAPVAAQGRGKGAVVATKAARVAKGRAGKGPVEQG